MILYFMMRSRAIQLFGVSRRTINEIEEKHLDLRSHRRSLAAASHSPSTFSLTFSVCVMWSLKDWKQKRRLKREKTQNASSERGGSETLNKKFVMLNIKRLWLRFIVRDNEKKRDFNERTNWVAHWRRKRAVFAPAIRRQRHSERLTCDLTWLRAQRTQQRH